MNRYLLLPFVACLLAAVGSATRVHVVFMNHLDVGYDGIPGLGFVNNVLNQYFDVHFPQALRLSEQMRQLGYAERFRYTTHPWLLDLYLDCPNLTLNNLTLHCPNSTMVAAMKRAMKVGDILWHAGPMNVQFENMNSVLLEAGLNISRRFDMQYQPEKKIRVLSQRDIPGMTNQVMSVFKRNNIAAVSVGVNMFTISPELTREPFLWRDGQNEIVAIWHPGGYPNNPGDSPSNPGGLSIRDCSMISGVPEILCFSFRTDNSGPPQSPAEVLNTYKILTTEFPGAQVTASTLENFVSAILPYKSLMQVVKTEIADSWVQGISTDPKKMAHYRALSRAYASCYYDGKCRDEDPQMRNVTRYMLKLPEHTYGLDKAPDQVNYSNEKFRKARSGVNYVNDENSWDEQRMFNTLTYEAAKGSSLQGYMDKELKQLTPDVPATKGLIKETFRPDSLYTCGNFTFSFHQDGSIDHLQHGGQDFANDIDRLARFVYRTYNETDDDRLTKVYGNPGYGKPNITNNAHPISQSWPLKAVQQFRSNDNCNFVLVMQPVNITAVTDYGAPQFVHVAYNFTLSRVDIEVVLVNKTTTRIEEALFVEFRVSAETQKQQECKWWLNKIDGYVDPMRVVYGGSVRQHAIADHVLLHCKTGRHLLFRSLDVPVVCPLNRFVEASVLPYMDRLTSVEGVSFNIYNNLWNVNFIFWYPYRREDANFKARFSIAVA